MTNRLTKVAGHIAAWQAKESSSQHSRAHRCLECIRACCAKEGLHLPPPTKENTAFANFEMMRSDPSKYGWQAVHSPLPSLALVYFKGCGKLPDGRVAGHIALLDSSKRIHMSNMDYPLTKWWTDRLVGAFVPSS